jgi:hypothetical protein
MISFYRMGTPLPGKRMGASKYVKDIAKYISKKHGVECTAAVRIGGPAGRCGIRARFDDMAAFEKWIEKARSDKDYIKLTETAADVMQDSEDAVWKII